MPGATACLISMGEMLQCNYRVTGDKRGISLIGKTDCLWFGPDPEDDRNVIFGIRSIPIIRSNYITSVSKVDYNIMHQRFGHPSKEVLQHAQKLHSVSQRSTFLLRTVFALDVLLARCPIELSQKMKDVLPSPLSWCTLISNPSRCVST